MTLWSGMLYLTENVFTVVPWVALHDRSPWLFELFTICYDAADLLIVVLLGFPILYGMVKIFYGAACGQRLAFSSLFDAFQGFAAYRRSVAIMVALVFPRLLAWIALRAVYQAAASATSTACAVLGAIALALLLICFTLLLGLDGAVLALALRDEACNLRTLYRRSVRLTYRRLISLWVFKFTYLGWALLSVLSLGTLFIAHALPFYTLSYFYWIDACPLGTSDKKGYRTMDQQKFYMTTAIAYASRKPHFGNTFEIIMADALARYRRERGYDVFLCTGTDEHGQKIENYAKEAGITPKQYVDGVAGEIRGVWDNMNTSYDYFIRTTDNYHEKAVAKIFKRFYEQGDIYKSHYEGWYCTPCESFFTETQAEGGKCPDCGAPVSHAREEAYFFKMSKYADRLMKHIEDNPGFIEPESRKKEMVNNFLKAGLQDLCVSRTSFTWGIPVDFDPKHVVYVWLDALTNYITALGYDPDKTFDQQSEQFRRYWPADVHIIGKDILRFHTIYWPIFLMALDLPLPKKIFGHPWFNFGMDKMSKSKGNVIYADELAEHFTVDGVRYYALAEMPYANDGSITYENVIKRFNTDLVNNLGNLVKRTLDMQKKYFDRVIQAPAAKEPLDDEIVNACVLAYDRVIECMDAYHIADALEAIFTMLSRVNKYIDETTPWTLAKDETKRERLGTVLYTLLEAIRWGAVLLYPFIPATAEEILSELNTQAKGYASIGASSKFGALVPMNCVCDSKVLFARIDEEKMLAALEAKRQASAAAAVRADAPVEKPEGCALIGIDDFMSVELRTAQIVACEGVPKAKKLLKLQLDLGYEQRQVVSGIAKYYAPEQLIGKKIIVVANLKPATLCGVESNGMILASGEETVRVVFLDPETPLGERVR